MLLVRREAGAPLAAPSLPFRFTLDVSQPPLALDSGQRLIAVSPDASRIAYVVLGSRSTLMVRSVDRLDPLAVNLGGGFPFFSPDGKWLGFFSDGQLQRVPVNGGPSVRICQYSGYPAGATWGEDGAIVFATMTRGTGLFQVPASGGEPKQLTTPSAAAGEVDHVFPSRVPNSPWVLYTRWLRGPGDSSEVVALNLQTQERKVLVRGGSNARYVEPGFLVYVAAGVLRAARFDSARIEVAGDAVPVVSPVRVTADGAADFDVSRQGTLIYVAGAASGVAPRSLVWVDRDGNEEAIDAPPRNYGLVRLAPDGERAVLDIRGEGAAGASASDIWTWDFRRKALSRLTFDPAADDNPVWTTDGRSVLFRSLRTGVPGLFSISADGAGMPSELFVEESGSGNGPIPKSMSPDGSSVNLDPPGSPEPVGFSAPSARGACAADASDADVGVREQCEFFARRPLVRL